MLSSTSLSPFGPQTIDYFLRLRCSSYLVGSINCDGTNQNKRKRETVKLGIEEEETWLPFSLFPFREHQRTRQNMKWPDMGTRINHMVRPEVCLSFGRVVSSSHGGLAWHRPEKNRDGKSCHTVLENGGRRGTRDGVKHADECTRRAGEVKHAGQSLFVHQRPYGSIEWAQKLSTRPSGWSPKACLSLSLRLTYSQFFSSVGTNATQGSHVTPRLVGRRQNIYIYIYRLI